MLANNYSHSRESDIIRTEMDSGRARQRKTFRLTPIHIQASWLMTTTQLDTFRTWLEFEASFGAAFFNVPLVLDEMPPGSPAASMVARFAADRDISYECVLGGTPLADRWRVSATLEITP